MLDLDRPFWQINFGTFAIFLVDLSTLILIMWVPCQCFPLINHHFYQTPNIWIWATKNWWFSYHVSVVRAEKHQWLQELKYKVIKIRIWHLLHRDSIFNDNLWLITSSIMNSIRTRLTKNWFISTLPIVLTPGRLTPKPTIFQRQIHETFYLLSIQ